MMEVLNYGIMGISMSVAQLYMWKKLGKKKYNYKSLKFIICFITLPIVLLINYFYVEKYMRILLLTFCFMMFYKILFRSNIRDAIIIPIISQMIVMVSETVLIAIIALIFNIQSDFVSNNLFGTIMVNLWVSLFAILLSESKFVNKVTNSILNYSNKIREEVIVIISFLILLIANILAMNTYYKIDFKYYLIFNTISTTVCLFFILNSLKNKHNYIEVYNRYNTTISSLTEYEDILNKYRVSNHENKNQLLAIRNMVKNKDNKVVGYIDQLVENKLKDSESLMNQSMVIPEGGLRGLVYSKMLLMKDKHIHFDLSIDKSIHAVQLIELGDKTVLDICKIMGVFLDNAIEAVENLEDKFIDLEMSLDESELFISVTNNFEGTVDLEHIADKGFSTKGKGHGYGLSLVKEIIDGNKLLLNQKQISSDEFTQRLIVKMEKHK